VDLNQVTAIVEAPTRAMIETFQPGDRWLAGGTWLFSEPQPTLSRLFDLNGFGWPSLEADADGLTIAATCRIAELERWSPPPAWTCAAELVPRCCRALLGSFKVWNAATVGGNICLALPAGPMTALTAALDGECVIWSARGERRLPVLDVVTGNNTNALRHGEILRAVHLPARTLVRRASFRQISLTPLGRSAALLIGTLASDGAFALTVTASTVRPLRFEFPAVPPDRDIEAALAGIAPADIHDDIHGRPAWRRHVTRHLAREIAAELRGEASGAPA
jgi:CO/xanthine dehydrogenase FAD-binding subunit